MTIQQTLSERGSIHGPFPRHAEAAQSLKDVVASLLKINKKTLCDEHLEALEMICHKIGRIIAGNELHKDHWHDIAGYATLGERACDEHLQSVIER